MKITSSDVLAIMRRYGKADDSHVPRHIEQLQISHPSAINTMAKYKFQKNVYYVLFDDTAEDDTHYILGEILKDKSDAEGVVLENPTSDIMTYGLPFKGKDVYLFELVSGKQRLDVVLAERYPEKSRSTWQKLIKQGCVRVNSRVVDSPKSDVTEADDIRVTLPEETDYSEHELPILYIDDNVIVINKPVGVLTHAKGALSEEFTVADFVRRYTNAGLDTNRPGIVHRLDRDTSGVLIAARNADSSDLLKRQFADRKVKKTYIAVVDGAPKHPHANIDLPIGRNPTAPSTFRVDPKGKSAETSYNVLHTGKGVSLVELKPTTGRTHQLRVHMAYLGTPIHGDRIYGKPADRLYLHAAALEVTIPHGERTTFQAEAPADFNQIIEHA